MSKRHSEQFKQVAVAYVQSNKDKLILPLKSVSHNRAHGLACLG